MLSEKHYCSIMLCKSDNPLLLLKCCAMSSRTNETQLPTDSALFLNFPPASKTVCPIPSPAGPATWAAPELPRSFSASALPLPEPAGGHHGEHRVPGAELPGGSLASQDPRAGWLTSHHPEQPRQIVRTSSPFLSVRERGQEPPLSFPNLGGPQCLGPSPC